MAVKMGEVKKEPTNQTHRNTHNTHIHPLARSSHILSSSVVPFNSSVTILVLLMVCSNSMMRNERLDSNSGENPPRGAEQ